MAIAGNSEIITKKFYTGADEAENYFDVDNLTAKLIDYKFSHTEIEDLTSAIVQGDGETGIYQIPITWPTSYEKVILVLEWDYDSIHHVERVAIDIDYITDSLERETTITGSFS